MNLRREKPTEIYNLIYVIGSLRNPKVPIIASNIRSLGIEAFDDWYAAGPEADDKWQEYEMGRKNSYRAALDGWHAHHVFSFDYIHLDRADVGLLVLPAGKSGHLELGYIIGRGKRGLILLDKEPERYDIMYNFAQEVFLSEQDLLAYLQKEYCH